MAPDVEQHHEEVVIIEDLGASQTGAESEVVTVSAETEQVIEPSRVPPQQQAPAPEAQAPRPSAPPQKSPPPK